jgi:hypothetical protein
MICVIVVFLSCRHQRILSDLEDNSSLNRSIGHGAHGFGDLLQREDAIDVRADASFGQQLYQRVIHAGGLCGKFLRLSDATPSGSRTLFDSLAIIRSA